VSGTAQAQHFLRNTLFRTGDLPPVLDLEPYPSQIEAMGGTAVLFRNVRAWIQAVERYTGVQPILYVSQSFVNRYLGDATDLKHNYQVWIARYSEYKPDVKLAIWQLSANGRVDGIRGDVDIDVFNGYQTQWTDFLNTMTITYK
jgi:lysozyme